jgi:hypothetical protein
MSFRGAILPANGKATTQGKIRTMCGHLIRQFRLLIFIIHKTLNLLESLVGAVGIEPTTS